MYALIEFAGKQFKVEDGAKIKVPYLSGKVGDKVTIDKVLYFDNDKEKVVGTPHVKNLSFDAKIVEHGREKKVVVFKFKRRKGYQRKNGHKQPFSLIEFGKLTSKIKTTSTAKKTTAKAKTTSTAKKTTAKAKTTSTAKKTSTKKEK